MTAHRKKKRRRRKDIKKKRGRTTEKAGFDKGLREDVAEVITEHRADTVDAHSMLSVQKEQPFTRERARAVLEASRPKIARNVIVVIDDESTARNTSPRLENVRGK